MNFTLVGVVPGTTWSVLVGGVRAIGNQSILTLYEPNGSYSWQFLNVSLSPWALLDAHPDSGILNVTGSGTNLVLVPFDDFRVTLDTSPTTGGSLTSRSGWYPAGTNLRLSAAPSPGFAFSSWSSRDSGGENSFQNPLSLSVNAPINETANFVHAPRQAGATSLPLILAVDVCLGAILLALLLISMRRKKASPHP
ncbi:MAG: hypothetical protein L3J93_03920 [Thermoplasmata archaeon]|nr:hypothetical protein [Thermoplasmata archaeon]